MQVLFIITMKIPQIKLFDAIEIFVYLVVCIATFLIVILFIVLINSKLENDSIFAGYRAEKVIGNILFSLRHMGLEEALTTYPEVESFGFFSDDGNLILGRGEFPHMNLASLLFQERPQVEPSLGLVKIMRPFGPWERHAKAKVYRPYIKPNLERPQFLYAQIYFADLKGNRIIYTLSMYFVPTILLIFACTLIVLYRKAMKLRKKLLRNEELARLGEVSRTLAHEIKNPLGAMKIHLGYLRKVLPPHMADELLLFDEETERIRVLTDRIGEFLKDPLGKVAPVFIESMLYTISEKTFVKIEIVNPSHINYVLFDYERLRSVIENILKNAKESMESVGVNEVVQISFHDIETKAHCVEIHFCDYGAGFDFEEGRAFDLFYTTKSAGSGIGLAIAKKFVEAAGGEIFLRSTERGGCVVLRLKGGADENSSR